MSEQILRRQEVGYVLLEECEVLIPANALRHLHTCAETQPQQNLAPIRSISPKPKPPVWHTVHLQSFPNRDSIGEWGDLTDLPQDGLDLVLQPCISKSMSMPKDLSWRSATTITPFNGMLSEIFIDVSTSMSKNKANNYDHSNMNQRLARSKRRSDASLLAGLAIEINNQAHHFEHQTSCTDDSSLELGGNIGNLHLRHLRVENVQIMFWESKAKFESRDDLVKEMDTSCETTLNRNCPQKFMRIKASLIVTFSLPLNQIQNSPNYNLTKRNQRDVKKKMKSKRKDKMLSSAYQLIGSIIRCDWGYLDDMMVNIRQKVSAENMAMNGHIEERTFMSQARRKTASKKPFFPDSLKVGELYDRISGASQHLGQSRNGNRMISKPNCLLGEFESQTNANHDASPKPNKSNTMNVDECYKESVKFLDLPEDIIATSIATYLRAPSLHAIRVTNRKLYRSLRAVVPGMKLKLFHHQIRSLEWMEMRERRCITEDDLICRNSLTSSKSFLDEGEAVCGGDYHRAVTGGATLLLNPRCNGDNRNGQMSLRFNSESGAAIVSSSDFELKATRCARGGLLCDDPGLGKTITVISLILRTFGLSTEVAAGADQAGLDDDSLFYHYWYSSFLTEHIRKPAILKLITRLIKSDKESGWFVPPIDEFIDDCPDYFDVIQNPISLQQIRKKYNASDCRDFKSFEVDIRLCFSNAMSYNPPGHSVYQAAERLNKNFDELLSEFKSEQVKIATKSRMANDQAARPLLDMLELKKRVELQERLVSSSSTLLVVPNTLLLHWQEQMLNINFRYISTSNDSTPIYYHTSKRNIKNSSSNLTFDLRNATNSLIFIDDGSKELPEPDVLARFSIVLTSYNRFTAEWKNGSVEQEVRASQKGSASGIMYWGDDIPEASSLLKVSWLRVIVDEGHVLGKSNSNLIQFASWLTAQRRWAMTGTPTQQIATQNGLRSLYHLANFLQHEFFNRRLGREKVWNSLISQGWKGGSLACFFRLKHIVSYLMVRHTKKDLVEIPPPIFSSAFINLSQAEKTTYNTLVSGIRNNIITTSMEGKTSGWQDSLLNPRQSKFASQALTNLRIACCGGLGIQPRILNKHWAETLEMLRGIHNLDDIKVQIVNNFIFRAQSCELSGCHSCGIQLQTLFVIPCGHLVCAECIDSETKSCPICRKTFDVDDFQRLQPGLDLQFIQNLQSEKKEREKQNNLQRALLETRTRGGVGNIDELGGTEDDITQTDRPVRSHRKGEHCQYSSRQFDGKCTICQEEHFDCNFMANSEQQCSVCFKIAEECPSYASKATYVIDKLLQLRNNEFAADGNKRCNVSPMAVRLFDKGGSNNYRHRPLKAIVFSQFRLIYEYFGDRLIRRFGGACVADYSYARGRSQELHRFIHEPDCFVMLLSKQGSVGLDLSFVTHIFFLDSIYDKSLEAQVVARAYRMGATGPVFVEQLTAKDSVEEVMNRMNDGHLATLDAPTYQKEKHAKLHTLLKSAMFIRPKEEHVEKKRKLANSANTDLNHSAKTGGVRFKD